MSTINDFFPLWKNGGGVFSLFKKLGYTPEWNSNPILNDYAYHGNHGGKTISVLCEKFIDENGVIQSEDVEKIVNVLILLYSQKWDKLYETLNFEYDPTKNYSREIVHNGTNTETKNNNSNSEIQYGGKNTKSDTSTITNQNSGTISTQYGKADTVEKNATTEKNTGGTETTTHGKTVETLTVKSAFDSTDFVNDMKNTETNSGIDATEKNVAENDTVSETTTNTTGGTDTETNSGTNTTTHGGTIIDEKTGKDTTTETKTADLNGTENYTEKITGATVDTVSLLQKQRKYLDYDFLFYVFADIDNVLSIPIY